MQESSSVMRDNASRRTMIRRNDFGDVRGNKDRLDSVVRPPAHVLSSIAADKPCAERCELPLVDLVDAGDWIGIPAA